MDANRAPRQHTDPSPASVEFEVEISEPALLSSLVRWLERVPDTRVRREPAPIGEGQLGVADIVVAIVGSSGVVAFIQTVPQFLRAKRSPIVVKVRHKGREVEVSGDNADDVSAILDKLLR